MIEWILLAAGVIIVILVAAHFEWDNGSFFFILVVVITAWSMYHWRDTPEEHTIKVQEKIREDAERERPRKINEVDGCSIYTFYRISDGRNHYFTKCSDKVTTESSHTESCGKNCTKQVTETIVTEKK